ncbi:MAG: type II toxin-antitoxin system prevent-host-death family antitoxin [Caldimonas sp.]
MQVNILEAKNQLSKLVKAALDGEDVIIANHGKPMVRLVKLAGAPKKRGYGSWKGLVTLAPDWDSPSTNAAIAKLFDDSPLFPAPHRAAPGVKKANAPTKKVAAPGKKKPVGAR